MFTGIPSELTKALHHVLGARGNGSREFSDQSVVSGRVEVKSRVFKLIFGADGIAPRFEVQLGRDEVMRLVNRLDLLPHPIGVGKRRN